MQSLIDCFAMIQLWLSNLTADAVLNGLAWFAGILGSIAFAINLAPQVYSSYKKKETGMSNGFFVLAYIGNIGCGLFVLRSNWVSGYWQYPLYANYCTALVLTFVLNMMKLKYKK